MIDYDSILTRIHIKDAKTKEEKDWALKCGVKSIGVTANFCNMLFITGPLYSGKRTFAKPFGGRQIYEVQTLAANAESLPALADELAQYDVVTAAEVGGGVVPIDPAQRAAREAAGRLACLLAERADCVVQIFCGLPTVLKGELPPC